jgi:hypothetical protein
VEEVDLPGPIYDDTKRIIDIKTSIKGGEVYRMFRNQTFLQGVEEDFDLKIFRNIRKLKLYKVAVHTTIFPCVESISWIVRHVKLYTKYILNSREHPITSFEASTIASRYHLDKGKRSMDENIIKKFPLKSKDLLKAWYNPNKLFKSMPSSEYPNNLFRMPYQYVVVMIYRLYGVPDASKLPMTWVPLIYYIVDVELTFNWSDILSTSLEEAIRTVKTTVPGKFPSFHMSSYLLDMVCIFHAYPQM